MKFYTSLYFYLYQGSYDFSLASNICEITSLDERLNDTVYKYYSKERCLDRWEKGTKGPAKNNFPILIGNKGENRLNLGE